MIVHEKIPLFIKTKHEYIKNQLIVFVDNRFFKWVDLHH